MGDIKRKPNRYSRPRKLFDAVRIKQEDEMKKSYGLKNKTEIWKTSAKVSTLRKRAKDLIPESEEEKKKFFLRLQNKGLEVNSISEVLALKEEDWLNRRLQTFVFKKNLAKTPLEARQLIVHKNVLVDGRIVNIPSFIVTKELENKISLIPRQIKIKQEEKKNEQ